MARNSVRTRNIVMLWMFVGWVAGLAYFTYKTMHDSYDLIHACAMKGGALVVKAADSGYACIDQRVIFPNE